jgi:hypothetical protein
MTYDHWKTTNPVDEYLGPEPPPCERSYAGRMHQHPRYPSGHCVECGADSHQGCKDSLMTGWLCWLGDES